MERRNAKYWRDRAEEVRMKAGANCLDQECRAQMLRLAIDYEDVAHWIETNRSRDRRLRPTAGRRPTGMY